MTNKLTTVDYDKLVAKWGGQRVEDVCIFIVDKAKDHQGLLLNIPATAERVEAILESIYHEVGLSLSALGHLREARALLIKENDDGPARSRELSVAITNLDTAILWRQYDLQIKEEPLNLKTVG